MAEHTELDILKGKVSIYRTQVLKHKGEYEKAKIDVHNAENIYKSAKHVKYKSYKDYTIAKKELHAAERRLSAYPRKTREWAKNNIGKVIDMFNKEDENNGS